MLRLTTRTTIAAVIAAAALSAPAANASPIGPHTVNPAPLAALAHEHRFVPAGLGHTGTPALAAKPAPNAAAAPSAVSAAPGFQWDDAAVGAGAMLVIVGLGAGAAVMVRRSRERREPALTS
jgi:hypothetical protein